MLDILNSGVQVDGVWTSRIDYHRRRTIKTGKPYVPVVGADNNEFLKQLINLNPKFQGSAVTNPADRRRRSRRRDQGAGRRNRAEVDEADAGGLGHGEGDADDQSYYSPKRTDVQLAAVHQAVDGGCGGPARGLQGAVAGARRERRPSAPSLTHA